MYYTTTTITEIKWNEMSKTELFKQWTKAVAKFLAVAAATV